MKPSRRQLAGLWCSTLLLGREIRLVALVTAVVLIGLTGGCDNASRSESATAVGPVSEPGAVVVDEPVCEMPSLLDFMSDGPLTDVECYPALMAGDSPRAPVFPAEIPSSARDVRLSVMPRIMQGAGWMYLAMTVDDELIAEIASDARRGAMKVYDAEELEEMVRGGDPFLRVAFESVRETSDYRSVADEITPSTRVYLFEEHGREDCEMLTKPEVLFCNHFSASGITIFHDRNEALFWA